MRVWWIMSNPRGRPTKRKLVVSPEQKLALRQLIQQPRSSRSLAFRARIVLECARGQNNAAVAARMRTSGFTVGMWRNRFISGGITALGDEVRPGAPRQIGDDQVERAVRLTLEEAPKGATHWSSRALATRTGLSQSTSAASGGRSDCVPIAARPSSCPTIRCWSTRCATSSACT